MSNLEYTLRIVERLDGIEHAIKKLGAVESMINKVKNAGSSMGSSTMSSLSSLSFGFNNILQSAQNVASLLSQPIQVAMDAEQSSVAFEVLLGSAKAAREMVSGLKEDAAKTPYSYGDLEQATKTMINFGMSSDTVRGQMMRLGDIAMGNKERFNSLSLVLGQVASNGKMQGGDLMQFINAGFNPLKELQRTTGKSMSTLRDEMSAGNITFEMVSNAMKTATSKGGMFFNMMQKQSQTTAGKLSTLKDNFTESLLKPLGENLLPILNQAMSSITNLITNIQPYTSQVMQMGSALGAMFMEHISPSLMSLWEVASPLLFDLGSSLGSLVEEGGMVETIFQFVGATISALTPLVQALISKFAFLVEHVQRVFKIFVSIGDKLGVWDMLYTATKNIGYAFKWVETLIQRALTKAAEFLEKILGIEIKASKLKNETVKQKKVKKHEKDQKKIKKASKAVDAVKAPTPKLTPKRKAKAKSVSRGIAGGGSKQTTFNISINKLVETINNKFSSVQDASLGKSIQSEVEEALLRAVNSVNQV